MFHAALQKAPTSVIPINDIDQDYEDDLAAVESFTAKPSYSNKTMTLLGAFVIDPVSTDFIGKF